MYGYIISLTGDVATAFVQSNVSFPQAPPKVVDLFRKGVLQVQRSSKVCQKVLRALCV